MSSQCETCVLCVRDYRRSSWAVSLDSEVRVVSETVGDLAERSVWTVRCVLCVR